VSDQRLQTRGGELVAGVMTFASEMRCEARRSKPRLSGRARRTPEARDGR